LKKAQEERMAAFQSGNNSQVGSGVTPGVPSPVGAPSVQPAGIPKPAAAPSFLDDWLAKRQEIKSAPVQQSAQQQQQSAPRPAQQAAPKYAPMPVPANPVAAPVVQPQQPQQPQQQFRQSPQPQQQQAKPIEKPIQKPEPAQPVAPVVRTEPEKLHVHDTSANAGDDGVSIKLR